MLFQKIRKNLSELLISSTAYGVPKIVLSKRLSLKIFWMIFFLLGSILSIYYVFDAINSYLEYEVITKTESIYLQPMPFPAVSFCPYIPNSFNNKPISQIINCWIHLNSKCQEDPGKYFRAFTTTLMGTCYRFNSRTNNYGKPVPKINSSMGGIDDSIILKFQNLNTGLSVWIHEPSSPPRFDYYNDHISRIYIPSNNLNQIILQKTVEKKLGLPYNDCYENVNNFPYNKTIIDFIRSTNTTYKQTYCFELCYEIDYIQRNPCNCTNTSLGNVWKDCWLNSVYNTSDEWGCTWKDKLKFFEQSLLKNCKYYCPLECKFVSYSYVTNSIPLEDSSLTELRIYYESLKYISIRQIPKSKPFDLISNIGLFIGVSFVSLFEISELIIEGIFICFERKKRTVNFPSIEISLKKNTKNTKHVKRRLSSVFF